LPLVSVILTTNLPPVSTTVVANNGNNIRLQTPLVNLKEKIYLYVTPPLHKGFQRK
jgi:hypothetical protein